MSEFYLLDQDTQHPDLPVIEDYPEEIEIMDFISGRVVKVENTPIEMSLSISSGSFRPDLITYLLPLFSDKMKNALSDFGVDNIDYSPVIFRDYKNMNEESGYWLANVIALLKCVDIDKSTVDISELCGAKMYDFESFVIDEKRTANLPLFRLVERGQFLIINEALKKHLDKYNFEGIRILNTRDYPGY